MGIFFRKSFKLGGGTRLNLSKSGFGISTGVKGLRISTNGSGTKIYGGTGPIRFQKSLSSNISTSTKTTNTSCYGDPTLFFSRPTNWHYLFYSIFILILLVHISSLSFSLSSVLWACAFLLLGYFSSKRSTLKSYKIYNLALEQTSDEESIKLLKEAYKINPLPVIQFKLAQKYYELKKYQEMLNSLQIIEQYTSNPGILLLISDALKNVGRYKDALAYLEKINTDKDTDLFMLACEVKIQTYIELKEYDKALDLIKAGLRKRLEIYAEWKRKLRVMEAEVYLKMDDKKKAKTLINELLKEVPEYEPANSFLAKL